MVSDICKKKHMVMVAGACFQLFDISSFILHTAAIGLQLLENSPGREKNKVFWVGQQKWLPCQEVDALFHLNEQRSKEIT